MDAQELRNLQEAYMKVAENQQQLDEANRIVKFNREDLDLYDIILSHLLDEGYS